MQTFHMSDNIILILAEFRRSTQQGFLVKQAQHMLFQLIPLSSYWPAQEDIFKKECLSLLLHFSGRSKADTLRAKDTMWWYVTSLWPQVPLLLWTPDSQNDLSSFLQIWRTHNLTSGHTLVAITQTYEWKTNVEKIVGHTCKLKLRNQVVIQFFLSFLFFRLLSVTIEMLCVHA